MKASKVSISLEPDLLSEIDRLKGDIPRSRFIVRRLRDALKKEGVRE
jgi:hypothetical protein